MFHDGPSVGGGGVLPIPARYAAAEPWFELMQDASGSRATMNRALLKVLTMVINKRFFAGKLFQNRQIISGARAFNTGSPGVFVVSVKY